MESVDQLNSQLRVLKQAVLQEKEQRKENTKLAETIKSQIRSLEDQSTTISVIFDKKLKEKQSVEEELKKTQEQLKNLKLKHNPLKKSFGNSKSILALQAQNEKLIEEYSVLEAEHKQDESYINRLKIEYSQLHEHIQNSQNEIKALNEECYSKQELSRSVSIKVQSELEAIHQQRLRINEKTSEIQEDIEKLSRKNTRLAQDLENLKNFTAGKLEIHTRLQESVQKHEKIQAGLTNELQEAKSEFFDSKSFLQGFQVRINCLLLQAQGVLLLKKSNSNEFLLELCYKGKVESVLFSQIEDVFEHPTKENRVVIKYKSKTKDIITEEKQKIIARIREILQRCGNLRS